MNSGLHLLSFLLVISASVHHASANLKVEYQWSQLEFDYPTEEARQAAIDDGSFNAGQLTPIDTDVIYSANNKISKVFVTVPRGLDFQAGVPATLTTITHKTYDGNPILAPYPSWSWHQEPEKCKSERLVSVFRTMLDLKCNRLWVMDSGALSTQTCAPQVLAFDLTTNELVHKYELPPDQYNGSVTILLIPVVDVRDTCDDVFVYLPDVQWFNLVVHDVAAKTSWNVRDKSFQPEADWGKFTINGTSFNMMDGIFGMAISPYVKGEDRKLYYHALASNKEYWVSTSNLRDKSLFADNPAAHPEFFNEFKNKRYTQSASEIMDSNGILYFGLLSDTSIGYWNSSFDYLAEGGWGVIETNGDTLQFPNGMKVIKDAKGNEQLWTLTSRYQKIVSATLDSRDINFRILSGNIPDIIPSSACVTQPLFIVIFSIILYHFVSYIN